MAAISPTAGAQAVMQAAVQRLELRQARQNADRAEQVAQALEGRAADAQRVASRAQENARSLAVQSDQARSAAGQARQGVAAIDSVAAMKVSLENTLSQVVERQDSSQPVVQTAAPVVNTTGQLTGTVVNTTA